jgi:serine phosphatase RsbU (regulator of sigma subunit)/anti-sigma regulatory factor (Ser/Thr protein kinase)
VNTIDVTIDDGDPLLEVLRTSTGPVDLDDLPEYSPAVRRMRTAGVQLVVPMVASGALVGVLALGERRSERGYSRDDRKLLENLARQAAPALRVGQLVRQQEQEARRLQRIESELQVAQLIQQNFLPSELPSMHGWQVDAFYLPARTVGGDFYDVIALTDGRIMVVTGDVTDKGVPAALVMASTHALLRAAAKPGVTPGMVLGEVNDLLHPQIPTHMFVTCLVLIFDPRTGAATFANAGHNLPYLRRGAQVTQLYARGMPLGLMPASEYEESAAAIEPGDVVVLYSDGITEQHNTAGEMFDFDRMAAVVADAATGADVVDRCMQVLTTFSAGCEQEDDITLVAVSRPMAPRTTEMQFSVASEIGNEREVMDKVVGFVGDALAPDRLAALGTAVSETAMNAIEHGNEDDPERAVEVSVVLDPDVVVVTLRDQGAGRSEPAEVPDLDAKLAGLQSTRGWGLFLVEQFADEVLERTSEAGHEVRLRMHRSTPEEAQP